MIALVTIDDNTRYLISWNLPISITSDGIIETLNKLVRKDHKPGKILLDLEPQFKDIFEESCKK